jgi:flavin prenyltransferase
VTSDPATSLRLPGKGKTRKIVVGVTGASGAPYAQRLLQLLADYSTNHPCALEVGVCLSSTAEQVWQLECGRPLRDDIAFPIWGGRDYRAPFASGSAGWDAMVIVPCSMGTVARIAHGTSETLLTRAADVMLKERRTLILVPRETPLSTLHLENLTALSRYGALVMPAMPSFYREPKHIEDLLDSVLARVLDHLQLPIELLARWGSTRPSAKRSRAPGTATTLRAEKSVATLVAQSPKKSPEKRAGKSP